MTAPMRNPVLPGFHPDPSICRSGADYYVCTSTFEYFPGLPIYKSRDLLTWTLEGHALHRPEQMDFSKTLCSDGIFAPTLRYHEGVFYVISTQVGGRGNFIVSAKHPAGPWSDPVWITDEGEPWFDPSLFFDGDGRVYYTRRHGFCIVQAEIDVASGRLLTPLREIARPWCTDDIEGPHLYRVGGWCYLLTAEGGTGWGHCLTVARSMSPWGPFEPCPQNPILTHRHLPNHPVRYTGHGDWFEEADGKWGIVFLGTRHHGFGGQAFHHLGRETFYAPMHWQEGWPVISQPVEESGPAPEPFEDRFEGDCLGPRWVARRRPDPSQAVVSGGLRLSGGEATLNDSKPEAFRGIRLDRYDFTWTADMRFAPKRDGEEAGLALVMADDCHLEWVVTRRDDSSVLLLRRRVLDLCMEERFEWTGGETVCLRISGNARVFTMLAAEAEPDLHSFATAERRLFCTEVATGWTGLMAGVYASGNGQPCSEAAVFSRVALSSM